MNSLNNYKNKSSKNHLRWGIFIFVICLFVGLGAFFANAFLHPFSKNQVSEIKETWVYYTKDDPTTTFKSQYIKRLPRIDANEAMVMERTMGKQVENPMLLVQGDHQWVKVKLAGKVLYDYTPTTTGQDQNSNPGRSLKALQLPANYVGQKLEIEVSSPYKDYVGVPPRIFVGEANSLISLIFSVSMPQILLMISALSISIALFAFVARSLWKNKQLDLSLLVLALFAVSIGLQAAAQDIFAGLIFSPIVNSTLATVLAVITPLFLTTYYYLKMIHVKRFYKFWAIPHIIFSSLMLLIPIFTAIPLPEVLPWINTINIFGTLVATFAAIKESHYKNRFYVFCTPWIVLVALAHCFLYIMGLLGTNYNQLNFNGFFFMVILVILFGYTVAEFLASEEKNRRQMNFLQVKTTLLEESRQEMSQHLAELAEMKAVFANNLQMMQLLLEDENLAGTKEYLQKLQANTNLMDGLPLFTENTLANLILSRYQKLAEKRSINTDFQIILPKELEITDDDLTKLFAHLLEHAYRETYAISDPRQRQISLRISHDKNRLHVLCQHTANYQENIFNRGITSDLPEKEEFDLWVLEKISKKYAGRLTKSHTGKTDNVEIFLSI